MTPIALVCTEMRGSVKRYRETGDAPRATLEHIDKCPRCLLALEKFADKDIREDLQDRQHEFVLQFSVGILVLACFILILIAIGT